MSCSQLVSELHDGLREYQVEFESKQYNVEVEILENTEQYLHVVVAVDDGSLPASINHCATALFSRRPPNYLGVISAQLVR
jgi:hypothetical protein